MDWSNQNRVDTLTFTMVNPTNLNSTYGELENVILDGSSLSAAYYSDTRTSGEILVDGFGWRRGSFIRVKHTAPGWSNNLGTYIVTDDDADMVHGAWTQKLVLQSTLFALSVDRLRSPFTIAKGAYGLASTKKVLSNAKRPAIYNSPLDHKYGSVKVYETGTTLLSMLYDTCDTCGNRLDVDGYGRVTVGRYIAPNNKTPKVTLNLQSPVGVVRDGVSVSSNWLSMPNAATISYKYTDENGKEKELRSTAWASGNNASAAASARGYNVVAFDQPSEMSPATQATADKLAKSLLSRNGYELIEWDVTTQYLPIWEGDVVELYVPGWMPGYKWTRKCLVKSVELNLATMAMTLKLKETKSGDYDDN